MLCTWQFHLSWWPCSITLNFDLKLIGMPFSFYNSNHMIVILLISCSSVWTLDSYSSPSRQRWSSGWWLKINSHSLNLWHSFMVSLLAGMVSWTSGTTPSAEPSKGAMPMPAFRCGNAACPDAWAFSSQSWQLFVNARAYTLRCCSSIETISVCATTILFVSRSDPSLKKEMI